MSIYTGRQGVVKKLDILGAGINGTLRSLKSLTTSIDGVNKPLYSKLDDSTISNFGIISNYYAYKKEGGWWTVSKDAFTSKYGNLYYSEESDGYKIYLKTKYPAESSSEYDTGVRVGVALWGLFRITDMWSMLDTTDRFTTGSPFSFAITDATVTGNVGWTGTYYKANGNGTNTFISKGSSVTITRLTHQDEITANWGGRALIVLYLYGKSTDVNDYGTPAVKIPKAVMFNNVSYPLTLRSMDPLPT